MTNQLIEKYESLCHQIIEAFCKKQELDFEYWLANKVGGAGSFGDFIFKFTDIIHDLQTDQPKGFIFEWYKHDFDANENLKHEDRNYISYENYCLGERHNLAAIKETMLNNKPTGSFLGLKDVCIVY